MVGGDDSKSKTAERFDSHEGKRSLLPDMKEHRSKVAAVAFHGEIYAIGRFVVDFKQTVFVLHGIT